MSAPTYFVGLELDLGGQAFTASIGTRPWKAVAGPHTFADSLTGFQELAGWLKKYHCTPKQTVLCMEASGFFGEPLAYFLAARGYRVAVEPPVKVKRACAGWNGHKPLPYSRQVAEYACRYSSKLRVWQPAPEILRQVEELLTDCKPVAPRRTTKSRTRPGSRQSGQKERMPKDRLHAVDQEIRHLLAPRPTIADEWPCY